jgi:hypothetical protein
MSATDKTPPLARRLVARMRRGGPERVWTPTEFLTAGPRASIDTTLHRLVRDGAVRRLARGLYDIPRQHPRFGVLPPSTDAVIDALRRTTGYRFQPTGEVALNRLGLSEQVPAREVYLTDGPSRRVAVLGRTIELRRVALRRLVAENSVVGLVLEAIRALGERIDDASIARIRWVLDEADRIRLARVEVALPERLRSVLRRIVDTDDTGRGT